MAGDAFGALQERLAEYQSSGDPGFLLDDQVLGEVTALRAATGWPGGPDHVALHDEAIDMLDAGAQRGELSVVDRGISLMALAVLAAAGDRYQPYYLSHLGTAWLDRFEISGRDKDVGNSVAAHRRAIAVPVPDAEDQAGHLANYSSALLARFQQHGRAGDLDAAVMAAREAVTLAREADPAAPHYGPPVPDRAATIRHAQRTSLSCLSVALLTSVEHREGGWAPGLVADLDEAVRVSREAATLAPAGDPSWAGLRVNLGQALLDRFHHRWQVADLTEAVEAARAALAATAATEPAGRARCLVLLARAYRARYLYTADPRDLTRAIEAGHSAVAAVPDGHPGQPVCLSNLGIALHEQFARTGDTHALDEAITAYRRAVDATRPGQVNRRRFGNNLGYALRARSGALGGEADNAVLEEAVAVLGAVVAEAADDAVDRPGCVANLAGALVMLSERGDRAALRRAIALLETEVAATAADHPVRHVCLSALGNAWRSRYDATLDHGSLENAAAAFRQAAAALPAGHPRYPEYQAALGSVLRRRFEHGHDPATAREAIGACQAAAGDPAAPVSLRAQAARDWGEVAAGLDDATEAMNGFATAVALLDQVAWTGLERDDQERQLGRFVALAGDAAAWAIAAQAPERAVELLEQGRGVLLAQSLDERARYHDLAIAAPDLAARLEDIDWALGHLPGADDPVRDTAAGLASQRQALTNRREELIGRIRRLPGFAAFLRPPDFATLREAAADGPVVIINVSAYRCDALTVRATGVRVTPLVALTGAEVAARASAFLQALLTLEGGKRSAESDATIEATLAWLWDKIVAPLLPDLATGRAGPPGERCPRVWWCPTGPLTFLPLHAAGLHRQAGDAALDWFVSSYAPTLRLLRQARQAPARQPPGGDRRPLVVALPETPGQRALPAATREADAFARRFAGATQLRGPAATVAAVRKALAASPPWTHFACHGRQDVADPSAGRLALYDAPLRIGEVSKLRLSGAELAFLSACETSRGGVRLADEAITLATAFQLAGYRHVIGTLWVISDMQAPRVADRLYGELAGDGTGIDASGTARALHGAVRELRRRFPGAAWAWAPYIHAGP